METALDDKPAASLVSSLDSDDKPDATKDGVTNHVPNSLPSDVEKTSSVSPVQDSTVDGDPEKGVTRGPSNVEKGVPSTDVTSTSDADQYVVFWEGDDDPANPQNWTTRQKWSQVWVIASITLITYVPPAPSPLSGKAPL